MKTLEKLDIPVNVDVRPAVIRNKENAYRYNGPVLSTKSSGNKRVKFLIKNHKRYQAEQRMKDEMSARGRMSSDQGSVERPG